MNTYEADPRHAEIFISGMGLDNAKLVRTPIIEDEMPLAEYEVSPALEFANAIRYKSLVA